jgi:2-dehydropantoate 2-reductase
VRKRRTEVDAQLGPVVEEAAALGVPTPCNARLIEMIHEIEDGARRLDRANLFELAEVH